MVLSRKIRFSCKRKRIFFVVFISYICYNKEAERRAAVQYLAEKRNAEQAEQLLLKDRIQHW